MLTDHPQKCRSDHSWYSLLLRLWLCVEIYDNFSPVQFNQWYAFIYSNSTDFMMWGSLVSIYIKSFCTVHWSLVAKVIIESNASEMSKWGKCFLTTHLSAVFFVIVLSPVYSCHSYMFLLVVFLEEFFTAGGLQHIFF